MMVMPYLLSERRAHRALRDQNLCLSEEAVSVELSGVFEDALDWSWRFSASGPVDGVFGGAALLAAAFVTARLSAFWGVTDDPRSTWLERGPLQW